tara:strand:- start:5 stop:751 length:747 start_codon:yes stop_codon:yes gene_type:complete
MHSGFFYKLSRLKISPDKAYLNQLVIFKWQSYLTFVTGILLLAVLYYYNSSILMVDKRVLVLSPAAAIICSILSMIISWVIYDAICKSNLINNNILFLFLMLVLLATVSFGLTKIFGAKFAFLSVGLIIGTNMFANVFTIIIPNQMNIINSSKKDQKFDMTLSLAAKQRSIHNNYSTFLVLFIMLSGHYSFIVYNKYNWLILCLIGIISALGRHYFNLRGRNINRPSILFTSIAALIILATVIFVFKN